MNAAVSRPETSLNCSVRSSSAELTETGSALGSRSADGAPKQTVAGSMRATCRRGDVSLPWTCRVRQFRTWRSPSYQRPRQPYFLHFH